MVRLDDDIMSQLRAIFKVEADEHVQAMNRVLLALEKGPDEEKRLALMEEIFREAHSLKGAAGAADLGAVESTAHKLESILGAARHGEVTLTADLCDVLYEAIDAIGVIVEASLEDRPHGLDLPDLYARLEAAKEGRVVSRRPVATPVPPEPELAPAPVAGPTITPAPVATTASVSQPAPAAQAPEVPVSLAQATSAPVAARDAERPAPEAAATPLDKHVHGVTPAEPPVEEAKAKRAPQRSSGSATVSEETIRVGTSKLDALMTRTGELLVAGLKIDQRVQEVTEVSRAIEDWHRDWLKLRSSLSHILNEGQGDELKPLIKFIDQSQQRLKALSAGLGDLNRGFSRDALHLSRITNDLGEGVMRVRMLPVSTVFDAFPRLVRDLCRELGKEVDVEIHGGDTELDRKVLEEIKDPLLHILRNSVDHGVEDPRTRVKAGKYPQGKVILSAFQKGNTIVIEVSDDGGGIDVEKVKRTALKQGLLSADDLHTMSDEEAMRLIFVSGFSTSTIITDISGRGVGMDVVRRNVEALHGQVDVQSVLGQGATVTLTLPLTLATTQELLVQVNEQTFGIPITAVERIQRIAPADIRTVEGREAVLIDHEPVSLVHLAAVLELKAVEKEEARTDQKLPIVILTMGRKRIAFLVDAVVGQQESVVKSLGKQLARVRNVAGATILGSGQVIMTLNPVDLMNSARLAASHRTLARKAEKEKAAQAVQRRTVLVVDDSLTTRNLEKNILETAGFQVKLATDGSEALTMLRSAAVDAVVSDVMMPHMTGFDLTANMRSDPRLKDIPVILVTSLDSREDKERGIEVGANAYIVKSTFDQESLLETISQLV